MPLLSFPSTVLFVYFALLAPFTVSAQPVASNTPSTTSLPSYSKEGLFTSFIKNDVTPSERQSLIDCRDTFGFTLHQGTQNTVRSISQSIKPNTPMPVRARIVTQEWAALVDRWNDYLNDTVRLQQCRYPINALVRAAPFVQHLVALGSNEPTTKSGPNSTPTPRVSPLPLCTTPSSSDLLALSQRKELRPELLPPMDVFLEQLQVHFCLPSP